MNFIIWSKDRPAQLYLLLESIKKNLLTANIFIHCITKSTSSEFAHGYEICRHNFKNVCFFEEKDFYNDSISCIENMTDKVVFLTDDTVFYSSTTLKELLQIYTFLNSKEENIFSFRLGQNTFVQDHINGYVQDFLVPDSKDGDIIRWCPSKYPGYMNYGYPFAIDAHIYNLEYILPLVKSFRWKNTNELEGGLQKYNYQVKDLGCFTNSRAVNIPYNNLSGLTMVNPNNSCTTMGANQNFLLNKKIDLETIENTKVIGCHQDIELKWVER
jgi:hypothetical protein